MLTNKNNMKHLPTYTIILLFLFVFGANTPEARSLKIKVEQNSTLRVKSKPVRKKAVRRRAVNYRYRNMPTWGATVNRVDARAIRVGSRNNQYRFHNGVWYQSRQNQWGVARPVAGTRIQALPRGCRKVAVGRRTYFYYYGTYYQIKGRQYEVVRAPIGAEVASLPAGYREMVTKNRTYYVLDGVHYLARTNRKGEEMLVVVPHPRRS